MYIKKMFRLCLKFKKKVFKCTNIYFTPLYILWIVIIFFKHILLIPVFSKIRFCIFLRLKYLPYSRAKYLAMAMVSGILMPPSISKTGTHMQGISRKNKNTTHEFSTSCCVSSITLFDTTYELQDTEWESNPLADIYSPNLQPITKHGIYYASQALDYLPYLLFLSVVNTKKYVA